MIRKLRTEGIYVLLVILVALVAALPLRGPGLISNYDSELHLYRTFLLDRALHQGLLFPRVLPEFMYSYGYPLFNFYPPASTYLSELLHVLGLGFLDALSVAYGSTFLLGGITMYVFARFSFSHSLASNTNGNWSAHGVEVQRGAALVAASAYILAPYFLINVYTRGALSEALGMAIFPALLLAVHFVAKGKGAAATMALALLSASLILTHSGFAMVALPIAAAYGMMVLASPVTANRRKAFAALIGGLLLGLALSAFFWLPAAAERAYVSIHNIETGSYDVHGNFQEWTSIVSRELFYPPTDPIPNPPRLGILQALLGLMALPLIIRRGTRARHYVIFWAFVGLGALFMMTPGSAPVWDSLPLLRGLSFSWRMLGIAAPAFALLAGSFVTALRPRLVLLGSLVIVMAMLILAIPGTAPQKLSLAESQLSIGRYWQFEYETTMVGTTSANEYVPLVLQAGTNALPRPPDNSPSARQSEDVLGTDVRLLDSGAQRLHLRIAGGKPTSVIGHAVYFPGWRATIDGAFVNPYPSSALGLVTLDVPPGEHEVLLYFDQSAVAETAERVSQLAALVIAVLLLLAAKTKTQKFGYAGVAAWLCAAIWLGGLAWSLSPPRPTVEPVLTAQRTTNGDTAVWTDIELLGWHAPLERAGMLHLDLFWFARKIPARDEIVSIALRDSQDALSAKWERQPQYGYSPTRRWLAGEVIPDEYELALPSGLAAGDYVVAVALKGAPGEVRVGTIHLGEGWAGFSASKAQGP